MYKPMKNLKEALEESSHHTALIFKYSRTCPISGNAKAEVDAFVDTHPYVPVYLIIIQEQPDLKMQVAQELDVTHESPQLIALDKGNVKTVLNHYEITQKDVEEVI